MATTWSDNRNRNSHQEHARILRELCLGTTKEAIGRLQHLKFLANFRVFAYALRSRKWGIYIFLPVGKNMKLASS